MRDFGVLDHRHLELPKVFAHNPSFGWLSRLAQKQEFNGESRWSPRNDSLQTPPGPEGSNGSNGFVCRGVAGVIRLPFKCSDWTLFRVVSAWPIRL